MAKLAIQFRQEALDDLCRRWHIQRLSVFGSALRDDFGPDSDVDVLVEFEPEHTPGWEIADIGEELSEVFAGRYVDMVDPEFLIPGMKERVLASAVVQYEAQDGEG